MSAVTIQNNQYGALELRKLYQKYATRALIIAASIHFLLIGSYYAVQYFSEEEPPMYSARVMKYSDLGPPPSISNATAPPPVSVAAPTAKPTVGTPVPVPDAEVSPEITIADQKEMASITPVGEGTGGDGPVQIEQDVVIDDGPPPDFVAVEKQPQPVKNPAPVYPEIARRAGVEGTVWVKIWVDKEGKPKKAEILKSDAELFNQPAIDAAMQWVFTPAIMNNGPVAVWVSIPFRFKLNAGR